MNTRNQRRRKKKNKKTQDTSGVFRIYAAFSFLTLIWAILTKFMQKIGVMSGDARLTGRQNKDIRIKLKGKIKKPRKSRTSKRDKKEASKDPKDPKNHEDPKNPKDPNDPNDPKKETLPIPHHPSELSIFKGKSTAQIKKTETNTETNINAQGETQPDNQKWLDRMRKNIGLSNQIPRLINKISESPKSLDNETELGKLAAKLAFIYRFHRLTLLLKILAKEEGSTQKSLYIIRTNLVHNIGCQLLDDKLIEDTKNELTKLDLTELDELGPFKLNLHGWDFMGKIEELPLCKKAISLALASNHNNLNDDEINQWIRDQAIPLLNSFALAADDPTNNQSQYNDAIRTFIIIIGEHCPEIRDTQTNLSPFKQFQRNCRLKRNALSHHAFNKKSDETLNDFLKIGPKVNNKTIDDNQVMSALTPYEDDKNTATKKTSPRK